MQYADVKHYIGRFYAERDAYIEYDDPATTYTCCGAVLVASVLAETKSADVLSELTGLPVNFAAAVGLLIELQGGMTVERLGYVRTALEQNPEDFSDVEDALSYVLEEFWADRNGLEVEEILERMRGRNSDRRDAPDMDR